MRRKVWIVSVLSALVAAPAWAEPSRICFGRTYDAEHLKANPQQNVRDIRARYIKDEWISYDIRVLFRDDPREFNVQPTCMTESSDGAECVLECDGGVLTASEVSDGRLRLAVKWMMAETSEVLPGEEKNGGCHGIVTRDIRDTKRGEEEKDTVFFLYPRDPAECSW